MGPDLRLRGLRRAAAREGARGGAEEAASAPLLPSLPPGESREPGRGGYPVRPRSGEARPGSPGAGRGGVTAPSARPRGMHRGSRGRRRHSQVNWQDEEQQVKRGAFTQSEELSKQGDCSRCNHIMGCTFSDQGCSETH